MRAAIRATALLSGSSLIVIAAGVVGTKVRAELLGPTGLGQMVLLQTICQLAILIFGIGLAGSLPRFLAASIEAGDVTSVWAVRRSVFRLRLVGAAVSVGLLILLRMPIAHWVLRDDTAAGSVVVIGLAVGIGLVADLQQGLLLAYHRVRAMASLSAATAVGGAVVGVVVIAILRRSGIATAILGITAVSVLLSTWMVYRAVPRPTPVDGNGTRAPAPVRAILAFSLSYSASQLIGGGIALLTPILVLNVFGLADVAYFQAAVSIGGTYLGFLVNAMVTDYYPRVSAARLDPLRLRRLMEDQQRLVLLISVPMLLLTLTFIRVAIPLVYTRAFLPAVGVLEWLLVGDLFKFASWTISFVILARARPRTFLLLELFGGVSYLGLTFLGAHFFGLQGLGIAWLVSYALYFAMCLWLAGRDLGSFVTKKGVAAIASAFIVVVSVPVAALCWGTTGRFAVGLPAFTVAFVYAALTLYREYRQPVGPRETAMRVDESSGGLAGGDFVPPTLEPGPPPGARRDD